jgi:hypothetical protein
MSKFIVELAVFFGLHFRSRRSAVQPTCDRDPAVNVVPDLVFVGIPLYKLWRVRLPTRQRRLRIKLNTYP